MNNLLIAGAIAAPIVAGATAVGGYSLYQQHQAANNRAHILNVAEVTKMEKVPFQREECWKEKVVKVEKKETASDTMEAGSTVLGAVIGGAIAHKIGDGHGKQGVATVAGAAVGGKIGHDVYRKTHKPEKVAKETYEPRCKTVTDYRTEEKPAGYDVTYVYKDQTFTTHMDEAPQGEYLQMDEQTRLKLGHQDPS